MTSFCHLTKSVIYYLLFFIFALAAVCCTDPYSFRIKGSIVNLRQADFLIYSLDGGLKTIDTIHVIDGSFDWQAPLNEEATFHIIFPNQSEQVVFGEPGRTARIEGDANELRAIRVTGTDDNEALTEFRMAHLSVTPRQLKEAMESYIDRNPDSHVSVYMQRQLTMQDISYSRLKVGQRLPKIILPPDDITGGDTLRLDIGRPVLLIFWASWHRESTSSFFDIQRIKRQVADLPASRKLRPISVSLDLNPEDYRTTCRFDSVTWESRCYRLSWSTPIVEQLGIRDLPYYVLTDDSLRIIALGTHWKNDIQASATNVIFPVQKK